MMHKFVALGLWRNLKKNLWSTCPHHADSPGNDGLFVGHVGQLVVMSAV